MASTSKSILELFHRDLPKQSPLPWNNCQSKSIKSFPFQNEHEQHLFTVTAYENIEKAVSIEAFTKLN